MKTCKFRKMALVWLSGFFGLGAFVHAMRLLTRVSLTVGEHEVPIIASAAVFVIMTTLSAGLLYAALYKEEAASMDEKSCCPH